MFCYSIFRFCGALNAAVTVTKVTDISGTLNFLTNNLVMVVSVSDSAPVGYTLDSFTVSNSGTLSAGLITKVKIYLDYNTNNAFDANDIFIAQLNYDSTSDKWTNHNITFATGFNVTRNVLVMIDIGLGVDEDSGGFKGVIPANGVVMDNGSSGGSSAVENANTLNVGQFMMIQQPMGANLGVYYSSIAFGDYDNDGDLDIALTGYSGKFIIYRNDSGVFTNVQEPMGANKGVWFSSIAFGDYDNDGDLDIALTGWDGFDRRFITYRNDGGVFNQAQEPMGINQGVVRSSIAFGDIDNDGDLDIALTGNDGAKRRFIIYRNIESTVNSAPSVPLPLPPTNIGGYWCLRWNPSSDDHTPQNLIRYQIAIGTNSGVYDYASTNIDYPRGQANLGKVTVVTGCYYQTKITNTKIVYWKVCAIDSAFKHSAYCAEQNLFVTKVTDVAGELSSYSNNVVMVVSIIDYIGHTLKKFSIGNAGTLGSADITAVNLWYETNPTNYSWDTNDIFVAELNWDGSSLWTNNNITFATSLSSERRFLVTIDLASSVQKGSSFQAYIPVDGVECSGGGTAPVKAITNTYALSIVKQFMIIQEPMGANLGVDDSSIAFGDYDNDGDLDIALTGWDGANERFIIFRNDAGVFNNVQEPMGANLGVDDSSIAFGDYNNDGDLDIALTGYDSASNRRFIIFCNNESTVNSAPSVPTGMSFDWSSGYWRLLWNPSSFSQQ